MYIHVLTNIFMQAARKAVKMYEAAQKVEAVKGRGTPETEESNSSGATFITEGDDEGGGESNWDKLIVSILSQPTAEWIVHKQTPPGKLNYDGFLLAQSVYFH